MLYSALVFIGKVILIEWAIEFLRFCTNSFITNIWQFTWLSHSNKYADVIINVVETLAVMALLYLGYNVYFIITSVFVLSYMTKALANLIIRKK